MLGESEYRVRLGEEDRRQLALDLAHLLKGDGGDGRNFGELASDWLRRSPRVRPENEQGHVRHMGELLSLKEGGLTKGAIEAAFAKLDKARGGKLGPAMLNKLRSTGKLIVEDARQNRQWAGPNPFAAVKCRRVPRKPWPRITVAEFSRALFYLTPDRARQALVCLGTGIRPGEMKALRKCDVDFTRQMLSIHRSLGRDQTKTGVPREVPIPTMCKEALRVAMEESPSELVFPRPDGTRQRDDVKLSRILRTAFKKAGVCTGYGYTCRRCRHKENWKTPTELFCPSCKVRMWCEPQPKSFTWYSLRHAAATLHREAGADALAVKIALGHATRDVTDDVYTHFSDERYRAELNRLALPVGDVAYASFVDATSLERRTGLEPATLSLGSLGPVRAEAEGPGFEQLLSVADVAKALGVSHDTVYRLVHYRDLSFVRVLSCIRFRRQVVLDFINQGKA